MTHDYFRNELIFSRICPYLSILIYFNNFMFLLVNTSRNSLTLQLTFFMIVKLLIETSIDISHFIIRLGSSQSLVSQDDFDITTWCICQTFLNLEISRKRKKQEMHKKFFSIYSQILNCTSKTLYLLIITTEKQHLPYISIRYFNFCFSFLQFVDHISPIKY